MFSLLLRGALFAATLATAGQALAVSNTFAFAPEVSVAAQPTTLRLPVGGISASVVQLEQSDTLKGEIEILKLANSSSETKILHIGVGREVPQFVEATNAGLTWMAVEGGAAAQWMVSSPGAKALRIGLEAAFLPPGAEIRFIGSGDDTVYGPFSPAEIFAMGPTYWSPVLEGDSAIVEVFVGARSPAEVVMSIARVSHLFASPREANVEATAKVGESGLCEVDLICRSATDSALATVGRAVARMSFTSSTGQSSLCTGTLLNPLGGSLIPYFYSANHCISTQASASTLATHWFYDRAVCGSGSPSYTQLSGGATLLYANATSDVLLLRLNGTPPAGAVYAGWDSTAVTNGTATRAVHHPAGDVKKVSLGTIGGFSLYGGAAGSTHIIGLWNSTATGVTEGGSSGSGLFIAVGQPATEYRLRGGLHGGPSSCTASGTSLRDYYSRFDQAYPSIAQYLNPTTSCAYSLSPTAVSVAAVVTSGTFSVTTTSGCAWTATSNASWITASTSGTGSGTVTYSIGANTGASRTGTVTAGGQTFTVTQAASSGTSTNLLVNGGFEIVSGSGVGWVMSSTVIHASNASIAHTGSLYAWLGGGNSSTDTIYQDVSIPANAQSPSLQFWYQITTEEGPGTAYDRLAVTVQNPTSGATLTTLVTLSNLNAASGWAQSPAYDFSAFKGQTIRLRFAVTNDSSLISSFRIDDVTLTAGSTTPSTYALSVSKAGTGAGSVTSTPAGISCGSICSADFPAGGSVTLSASATSGVFAGWSGGCSGTGLCIVPMTAATAVTATFTAGTFSLTVVKAGTGTGTVTSSPAGINCGATCAASFASATTLTATASTGSLFMGWSGGGCTGVGSCTPTMSAATTVTATFQPFTGELKTRYRLYSPFTFEHLYTTDLNEYNVLPVCCAWVPEGFIYRLFNGAGSFAGVATVPYYRLYNPFSHQHHWTTDVGEYNFLPSVGWTQEGVDGQILPVAAVGALPLYRLYLNAQGGLHLWTIDAGERNYLVASAGWVDEGIAGYVIPLP